MKGLWRYTDATVQKYCYILQQARHTPPTIARVWQLPRLKTICFHRHHGLNFLNLYSGRTLMRRYMEPAICHSFLPEKTFTYYIRHILQSTRTVWITGRHEWKRYRGARTESLCWESLLLCKYSFLNHINKKEVRKIPDLQSIM